MVNRKHLYELENTMKGAANHRRVEILELLSRSGELSTDDIVEQTGVYYQTGASHVRRLMRSGLVYGRRKGATILHDLTDSGKLIIKLFKKLK